ncbi:MAG: sigma-70 family RNA polymerase sigma factor [Verrucomicrobiota bacterium]
MSGEALDVPSCLDAVRAGEQAAASRLVEHFYPLVIKIVRSHLPRRVPEEDLAQDVFVKMFTRLEQYRAEQPFGHWLSRIAVTTCLDALRAQKRRPELRWADLSEEEADAMQATRQVAATPDSAQCAASHDLVARLLETLGPEDRMVVTMMDLEGLSVAEVRARTGWGESKIKVRVFRARKKLKSALERLEGEKA